MKPQAVDSWSKWSSIDVIDTLANTISLASKSSSFQDREGSSSFHVEMLGTSSQYASQPETQVQMDLSHVSSGEGTALSISDGRTELAPSRRDDTATSGAVDLNLISSNDAGSTDLCQEIPLTPSDNGTAPNGAVDLNLTPSYYHDAGSTDFRQSSYEPTQRSGNKLTQKSSSHELTTQRSGYELNQSYKRTLAISGLEKKAIIYNLCIRVLRHSNTSLCGRIAVCQQRHQHDSQLESKDEKYQRKCQKSTNESASKCTSTIPI